MKKKKIILPKLTYENAPDQDLNIPLGFEEEKSLLRNDDRNIILNLSEQFQKERNECKRYKLYGKMKMIFRNMYLGTSDYDYLKRRLSLCGNGEDDPLYRGYLPYDEFAFLRTDLFREVTTGETLNSLSGFDGFTIITSGSTEHQNITAANSYQFNWNLYTTYVSQHESDHPMKYTIPGSPSSPLNFVSGDGIPFRVYETTTEYVLISPVQHGMSQGEYIVINNTPYYINSVGNSTYRSEKYVIVLLKSQFGGYLLNSLITGKRCTDNKDVENSTSQYYVHKHKVLTDVTDYLIDKVGFESPIWEDERKLLYENSAGDNNVLVERNRMESVLFDYFEPIVLTGLTNNLNYTPTELYTTVVFRNGNGYFQYPPKVGYSFHFHDSWVDLHFSGNTSNEAGITGGTFSKGDYTFISGGTLSIGTELHGAFVEYHPKEMKERIISEAFHKIIVNKDIFNHAQDSDATYSGATGNPIGLYYQPHYRFKIRELSPYTEVDTTNKVENLPENARYFPIEKVWRWRDLYDEGYIDSDGNGTDYPYMNDIHYIHKDINFYLRNEFYYTNKRDGITEFDKRDKINGCIKGIVGGVDGAVPIASNPVPSVTPSITPTRTVTPTPSITVSPSVTPSHTPSVTPSLTVSITPSVTASVTPSVTESLCPSRTPLLSASPTPSVTPTPSITTSPSLSATPSVSITPTITPTPSITKTPSLTVTPSITITPSVTRTPSVTITPSITATPSVTPTPSITKTPSVTITPSITATPSVTITPSITKTPSVTVSPSACTAPVVGTLNFPGPDTDTSFTVNSSVTSSSPLIERTICYSQTSNPPTMADNVQYLPAVDGDLSVSVTGLTPNTGYYVSAYARTACGEDYISVPFQWYTLAATPTPTPTPTATVTPTPSVTPTHAVVVPEVTIGTQTWMQSNITNNITDSLVYNNNESFRSVYGGMYTFDMLPQIVALYPGWHVPTVDEWNTLITYLGGLSEAGGHLKETGTVHWSSPNTGADNSSGFGAVGGGYYRFSYSEMNLYGYYWSSTPIPGDTYANSVELSYNNASVGVSQRFRDNYFSVRLIKNT